MSSNMIEVSFPSQKYGYVIIPGIIYRGRKQVLLDFLVDTGASTTMIDPRIMASIGYTSDCPEYVSPATVSSPAGKEEGFRVRVDKVLVHSAELSIQSLDVVCIRPERNVEALLGLNFLRNFQYCINHKSCVVSFERTI